MDKNQKETYRTNPVERFIANYESANSMEQYYQQRKMSFLYGAIKTIVDEKPDKIADLGAGEGILLDVIEYFFNAKVLNEIHSVLKLVWGHCCFQRQIKMRLMNIKNGCISECTLETSLIP